jgi:hypothetical protein
VRLRFVHFSMTTGAVVIRPPCCSRRRLRRKALRAIDSRRSGARATRLMSIARPRNSWRTRSGARAPRIHGELHRLDGPVRCVAIWLPVLAAAVELQRIRREGDANGGKRCVRRGRTVSWPFFVLGQWTSPSGLLADKSLENLDRIPKPRCSPQRGNFLMTSLVVLAATSDSAGCATACRMAKNERY